MKDIAITLIGIALLIAEGVLIVASVRLNRLENNLRDIDQRITILEQSLGETDKAVVKALQGSNEALYELKLMEINDN